MNGSLKETCVVWFVPSGYCRAENVGFSIFKFKVPFLFAHHELPSCSGRNFNQHNRKVAV